MKKRILLALLMLGCVMGLAACEKKIDVKNPSDNVQEQAPENGENAGLTNGENKNDSSAGDNSSDNNSSTGNNSSDNNSSIEEQPKDDPTLDDDLSSEEITVESSNLGYTEGLLKNGSGEVIDRGEFIINACSGLNESAYIEFNKVSSATSYNVYIRGNDDADYKKIDESIAYIRQISSTAMRVDLLGLKAGNYVVKLIPVVDTVEKLSWAAICKVSVVEYDRSGYAHFNYTAGVGAYKDDGTLKDNAIVIYVTDENKDNVMTEVCAKYGIEMFNIPNYFSNSWNNKQATGIGWWLNNSQYTKCEKNSSGVAQESKSSNTYSPTGQELGFYNVNRPIVIRFVGTVTTPEGCTAYSSLNEGGTVGDNGHMARMKNLNNVTLEGVGFDAKIEGWGLHFICTDTTGARGKSFEARNLTFAKYPEDALGMEGDQESTKITASVERCWVHHCTFLPGYCASPAESDKAEGDGSCDFKRGQYFTMSYCYYEYCHKTNLVGSSDSSLQYNISFHHNVWYNCGSRIPLLRNANLHFYNNYVYADINDEKAELSYVHSLRADCYLYSEGNYYEGCKQISDGKTNQGKLFNNVMVGCFNSNTASMIVTNREAKITNNCSYDSNDYTSFDTNPALFYYDANKKISDCYLTTPTVAREECLRFAGSYYRTILNLTSRKTTIDSNLYTVEDSVDLSSGSYTASLSSDKGILYTNVKNGKFKNQGITFKLNDYATVTVDMTGGSTNADAAGYLVSQNGEVMLSDSGTAILKPGIYYIVSCIFDKETTVNSLSFEKYNSEEFAQEALQDYTNKASAIPTEIAYTDACYNTIKAAMNAYCLLTSEQKAGVDYLVVDAAYQAYVSLGADYVEGLISNIGEVTKDSGAAIQTARSEYNKLAGVDAAINISNYDTLVLAEARFESFAVQSCIDKINAIGTVSLNSKSAIDAAKLEYEALSNEQKALVTNASALTAAIEEYDNLVAINDVEQLITNVDVTSLASMEEVIVAYNALSASLQARVSNPNSVSSIKVTYTIALIDAIGEVTASSQAAISKASSAYEALTSAEKSLVTNYDLLVQAKEAISGLITEYETTFDNDTNFTYTNCVNGSSTASINNPMIIVSNFKVCNLTKIDISITSIDKGTTKYYVYYSTDGSNWTEITNFANSSNKASQAYSYTLANAIEDPVYIKIAGTCSKADSNPKAVSVDSLKIYGTPIFE